MTTTLYYFSGTGNTLYAAKFLAQKIDDCEVIPMAKLWRENSIQNETDRVGLIFPLYYMGLPKIVMEFVKKLNLNSATYIFALVTLAGDAAGGALHQLNQLLKKKAKHLDAGFYIKFPGNYIIQYEILSINAQSKVLESAQDKIAKIADLLNQNVSKMESESFFPFAWLINKYFYKIVHERDRHFNVDQNCTSCGLCEKVCPVSNITLMNGKPQWNHQCQQCLACIHYCPMKAIQYDKITLKKGRYHHPKVNLNEISNQK